MGHYRKQDAGLPRPLARSGKIVLIKGQISEVSLKKKKGGGEECYQVTFPTVATGCHSRLER